jgi:hypothetical protein
MSRTIKGGIRGLWQRLQAAGKQPEDPQKFESDLQHIPDEVLEHMAPNPDWQLPAGYLKTALDQRLGATPDEKPTFLVVGLPHLKLWDKKIFNSNDGTCNLQCAAEFYLHPRHNPKAVIEALLDTALTSSYLQVLKPINIVASEKPWATQYRLKAYPVDPRDQFRFITDLTVRGKQALAGLGVDFPAPYAQPPDHLQSAK